MRLYRFFSESEKELSKKDKRLLKKAKHDSDNFNNSIINACDKDKTDTLGASINLGRATGLGAFAADNLIGIGKNKPYKDTLKRSAKHGLEFGLSGYAMGRISQPILKAIKKKDGNAAKKLQKRADISKVAIGKMTEEEFKDKYGKEKKFSDSEEKIKHPILGGAALGASVGVLVGSRIGGRINKKAKKEDTEKQINWENNQAKYKEKEADRLEKTKDDFMSEDNGIFGDDCYDEFYISDNNGLTDSSRKALVGTLRREAKHHKEVAKNLKTGKTKLDVGNYSGIGTLVGSGLGAIAGGLLGKKLKK